MRQPLLASDTAGEVVCRWMVLFFFLLYWGYYSLFEAFWNGQTPGKRLLKIRVIKDSGRQITLFEALARNLLRVVDMLPSFYLDRRDQHVVQQRAEAAGRLCGGDDCGP